MRGELRSVWSDAWVHLWDPLIAREGIPSDIFCELYREISTSLRVPPTLEQLADVIDDPKQSESAFRAVMPGDLTSERSVVKFFEEAYTIVDDLAGSALSSIFVELLRSFIEKFSLRYHLRSPCALCPTLPGIFSALMSELKYSSEGNEHVSSMLDEFDEALRELRDEISEGRIKTVIQKQINVLEAVGASCVSVRSGQLGAMCSEVRNWPHNAVRNALSNLYGFASDYPGIRHAGKPGGAIRAIDMRDLIAVSVALAGFTPYLRDNFDSASIYWGHDPARV